MKKKEESNLLPPNYKKGIPRVSEIVEFAYPFKNTKGELWFESWLAVKKIPIDDYMEEASSGGRYVHKQIERYLLGEEVEDSNKYADYIINGIEAIENLGIQAIEVEKYIKTKDYQGTIDIVAEIEGQKWVIDIKTYGLAKHKFGIESSYKKPSDKLKKARLQLSLYAHTLGIKNVGVLELDKEGYHFHPLKLIPKKQIEKIILSFKQEALGTRG